MAVTPETLQKCLYIADDIISCADQGTVDRAISVNEMKIFLKATKYEDFMVWLTGEKRKERARAPCGRPSARLERENTIVKCRAARSEPLPL